MVHIDSATFRSNHRPALGLFGLSGQSAITYPIQSVIIDWDRLIARRPLVLETIGVMPGYLLKPEVLTLLDVEKHPTYRLILDLMWSTGGRISEILAITPSCFCNDGHDFGVVLKTPRHEPGRPPKKFLERSPKRYIPIEDVLLKDRIESYLKAGSYRANEHIFAMARQTVNRHIHNLIDQVGGAPFRISAGTFRHSFAIHVLLHGRPLSYVAKLLGHRSNESAEIYTNVLTIDSGNFLRGVDFH